MPDNNEELKNKVDKLEKKIEDLEKKLEENTKSDKERDKQHHEELKALTQKNHLENQQKQEKNLTWNKMGAFSAPIATILIVSIIAYFQNKQSNKQSITSQQITPIKKDADSMNERLEKIVKLLEEQNKKKRE